MMVTEKEAEKMRCPFYKSATKYYMPKCVGSKCMAWRWLEGSKVTGYCAMVYPK